MVGVLIHDHVNNRAVFKLSNEQLSLVLFRKFEGYVDDTAAVLVFGKLDHIAVDLVDDDGSVYCFTIFDQLLDNIIAKDVDGESFQTGKTFVKDHLAKAVITLIKLILNEPATKLVFGALYHMTFDAHRVNLVFGRVCHNLKDLLQKLTAFDI